MILPELPEALIVRRSAHGYAHSFTAPQMEKYGQDCFEAGMQSTTIAGRAEQKPCTSDEWLTNATQSTRDLANKIKGQQRLRPCNHFLLGQITNLTTDCPYCELEKANSQTEEFERRWYLECDKSEKQTSRIKQLTGEHVVLINLLKEASTVIETIEAYDWEESESLMDLINKMHAAFNAAMQGLIFKCQTCGQTEQYDHRGCEPKVTP